MAENFDVFNFILKEKEKKELKGIKKETDYSESFA